MMTTDDLANRYPGLVPVGFRFEIEDGWSLILASYFDEIQGILQPGQTYELRQVKEKFGGLRIHDAIIPEPTDDVHDQMRAARERAQALADRTCERCGRPGRLTTVGGLMTTACGEHGGADE